MSSQVYEIVKTIYSTTAQETTEEGRIKVLQSTLGQLRLNNIATLDAMMTHFTRLIDLTSADEQYVSTLTQGLSSCILRPRAESSLTMNERHSYRLIRDLFAHKEAIFGELKRQSSALGMGSTTANRPRAVSTDESNRRAATEARQRAIVDRSRAQSPAPPRKHRRDRSSGASENGRFPINVASPPSERRHITTNSLDVPAGESLPGDQSPEQEINSPPSEREPSPTLQTDGSATPTPTAPGPGPESPVLEKCTSLPRSGVRVHRKPGLGSHSSMRSIPSDTQGQVADSVPEQKGVTLEDKPMDD